MNRKISIAVCYYLPESTYVNNEYCIPLQLGFHETGIEMGIQKDNTDDNRSLKHPVYSEYSGVYWLWKNVPAEYKGMMHHRRSFTFENLSPSKRFRIYTRLLINYVRNLYKHSPISYSEIVKCGSNEEYKEKLNCFLQKLPNLFESGYDIVVPKPYHFYRITIEEFFDEVVGRIMMSSLRLIFKNQYPDYYPYFEKTLRGSRLYYANLEIMRNGIFDEYCTFVFGVFDLLENDLLNKRCYVNLNKEMALYRSFGYIGELITNTFILKKKTDGLKIKELTVLYNSAVKGNETTDYSNIKL